MLYGISGCLTFGLTACTTPVYNCGPPQFWTSDKFEKCSSDLDSGRLQGHIREQALINRGAYSLKLGNYPEAIRDFTAAVVLEPGDWVPLTDRAVAYRRSGRFDLALADVNAALNIHPGDFNLLRNRAILARSAGDYAAAVRDDRTIVTIMQDDSSKAVWTKAIAYDDERAGDFDDAITQYSALINRGGDWSIIRALRGTVYAEKGNQVAAMRDYEAALHVKTAGPLFAALRCYSLARLGKDLDAALAECNEALAADPNSRDMHDLHGYLLMRMGRFRDAVDDYTMSVQISPDWAASQYGLGIAKRDAGDKTGGNLLIVQALDKD
jgi:tetratricopeptide (TPR) repeat protein